MNYIYDQKIAKAFQEGKPYQVSIWHWPKSGGVVGCSTWKKEERKPDFSVFVLEKSRN